MHDAVGLAPWYLDSHVLVAVVVACVLVLLAVCVAVAYTCRRTRTHTQTYKGQSSPVVSVVRRTTQYLFCMIMKKINESLIFNLSVTLNTLLSSAEVNHVHNDLTPDSGLTSETLLGGHSLEILEAYTPSTLPLGSYEEISPYATFRMPGETKTPPPPPLPSVSTQVLT